MFVKCLKDCEQFTAGDGSILRELLHPKKADLQIHYSLAYATVAAGRLTKPHKLRASEVYYIIDGRGLMHIGEESLEVAGGCAVYIPPNAVQFIENTEKSDLKFLCIVDPPWRKEDEQILNV